MRHLAQSTEYFNSSPILKLQNLPRNETISGVAEGLERAHRAYDSPSYVHLRSLGWAVPHLYHRAWILFVVQAGERNVFDQRWLEYELLEKYVALISQAPQPSHALQALNTRRPPDVGRASNLGGGRPGVTHPPRQASRSAPSRCRVGRDFHRILPRGLYTKGLSKPDTLSNPVPLGEFRRHQVPLNTAATGRRKEGPGSSHPGQHAFSLLPGH